MKRQPLSETEITAALTELDGWEQSGDKLVKNFTVSTYPQGLALASTIGMVADGYDHHPDITIGYKTVQVEFTTHDAGHKITATDVRLAKAIDALKLRL